jgi:hydantoinase/carbamoylase family amidase
MQVDSERLTADLAALSVFGRAADGGITRTSYSAADLEARRWLAGRCAEAGLPLRTDGLGNIMIRLVPAGADPSLPAVWTGSHVDTVPQGGAYDGAVGVLSGLECLRRLAEERVALPRPVQLTVFADEEGCYHHLLGSTGLTRGFTGDQLAARRGRDGARLVDALTGAGFDPEAAARAAVRPAEVSAYVELHIEQGPVLEAAGTEIGVVTGIVGMGGGTVAFTGRADHAGTTPMLARQDALRAAGQFLTRLPETAASISEQAVITCGLIEVTPGATNVVPATAELQLDYRDIVPSRMDALEAAITEAARQSGEQCHVAAGVQFDGRVEPVQLDGGVEDVVEQSALSLGYSTRRMPSGAGHDAQNMATITRAGMIFVPSVAGRSHTREEYSHPEDVARGANVLLETLIRLARQTG